MKHICPFVCVRRRVSCYQKVELYIYIYYKYKCNVINVFCCVVWCPLVWSGMVRNGDEWWCMFMYSICAPTLTSYYYIVSGISFGSTYGVYIMYSDIISDILAGIYSDILLAIYLASILTFYPVSFLAYVLTFLELFWLSFWYVNDTDHMIICGQEPVLTIQ